MYNFIIFNIIPGILVTIICGICIHLIWPLYEKLRFYSKLWGPFLNEPFIIISGRFIDKRHIGEGDLWPIAISLFTIWKYGSRANKSKIPLRCSEKCGVEELGDNHLILIGGPAANRLVNDILDETKISYNEVKDNGKYIISIGEKAYSIHDSQNKHIDYGVCILRRSPWNNEKWVLSISGIYSYGAEGIARLILNKKHLKKINKLINKKKKISLSIVVETIFHNDCFVKSEIIFSEI